MDDFASDVDQQDAMCLHDVKDDIAVAVSEPPHADVDTVITGLGVINGEFDEQINCVWRCKQGHVNLLSGCLGILLLEKCNNLTPKLNYGDKP